MAKSNNFKFHGGAASYIGIGIVSFLLTVLTLGIAYPWALCMQQSWKIDNTTINGRRLKFYGNGFSLLGLWIKWLLLLVVTLGIYSLWIGPSLQKWIVENTDYAD
jgi:uncharacterized membrane protein YjgN (DUF898 family)